MKKKVFLFILITALFVNKYVFCEKPGISAQSAILIDAESGRVLLEYNPHIKLPMASTTKIMTTLIALENGELTDKIKIKRDDIGIEGSSIYLCEGESISLEDLLYGLMLRSGNDSAVAISNHLGGNLEAFVNMMNKKAKDIGANNTNFMNPHGLPHDNHYSTAYDLALITREAMKTEEFKTISRTKMWKAERDKNNIFYNKNKTLWEYEGGDGVKIGYTKRAGRCLVSSATRNDTQLIAVVLNDRNWFNDCYTLMDYGFKNFITYVIFDKNQYFKKIPITDGNKDYITVVAEDSFLYPLKEEELERIKLHINLPEKVKPPISKGEHIGNANVYLDGKLIHEGKLIAKDNIKKIGLIKRTIKNFKK